MQQDKSKTLLVNILTAVVVVGVAGAAYFVFTKTDATVVGTGAPISSVAAVAEETTLIGSQIDYTVRELRDLERAVASSTVIFGLSSFRNLQDFSVAIPSENLGRVNPFVPTPWKIKLNAIKTAAPPRASVTTTTTVTTQTTTPAANFSSGI